MFTDAVASCCCIVCNAYVKVLCYVLCVVCTTHCCFCVLFNFTSHCGFHTVLNFPDILLHCNSSCVINAATSIAVVR
jgi:hypothetical protein